MSVSVVLREPKVEEEGFDLGVLNDAAVLGEYENDEAGVGGRAGILSGEWLAIAFIILKDQTNVQWTVTHKARTPNYHPLSSPASSRPHRVPPTTLLSPLDNPS